MMEFTKKRRIDDECLNSLTSETQENRAHTLPYSGHSRCVLPSRQFLRVPSHGSVFDSQNVDGDSTLYSPVTHDLLVNVSHVEQISFAHGSFFIADESGSYQRSAVGRTINMWRYDNIEKRLYISRAFLFTDPQIFDIIITQLEDV